MKNGELRGSERWDSASCAWVRADEWQRRQWSREDAAFARMANQGELCAPMIISDGMRAVRSQADGNLYDSKSRIRQHYKEAGVLEVGNDVPKQRFVHGPAPQRDEYGRKREIGRAMGQAAAAVGTMSDETMKRRAFERATKPL